MKTTLKKISDCKIKMTVEVEPTWVETRFQEVLRDFQKNARLPGFREGHAPFDLVEKKFAKEAHEEVLKTLIPEAYHRSVVTHKLEPVSLPSISDIKMERGQTLVFIAEFDKNPEFSLKNYKGIKIRRVPIEVTPEEVEKGLESLADSKAELVPVAVPRAVARGDFLLGDIEVWRQGSYVPGKKGVILYVEPGPDKGAGETDDFYDKVLGAWVDEVREICVEATEEEKSQGIVGRKPFYKVWIRGIQEKKILPIDDDFAKSFGKDNIDALREAVRKDIAAYKNGLSQDQMRQELFVKLLALISFSVPEGLVRKQEERLLADARRHSAQQGIPKEQFDKEEARVSVEAKAKAEEQVRLYFILRKVALLEEIDVDEVELERKLAGLAEESKRPMEEVRRLFEEDLRESLREAKTIDFLLANARFEE